MKGIIQFSLFVFFQITLHTVIAQNNSILFSKLDSINGARIKKVTGITQDPKGNMWFCDQRQNCIYRYDGNILTDFRRDNKNPNSLGLNSLETIYADDQGLIWIGGNSLDQYNPETGVFTHFRHEDSDNGSFSKDGVSVIFKDHKGNLWVGTGGLDRLDKKTGKFIHYRHDPGNPKSLSNNVVKVIYEDKKGVLWIGTGDPWTGPKGEGGLNRMNPDGSFTRYLSDPKNPNSLLNNKIKAIFEDSRGNFWVGTSGDGLHTMNRETGTFERHLYDPKQPTGLSGLPSNPVNKFDGITFIYEDKTGAIWIGSYLQGLSRYDPLTKQMTRFKNGNGFPDSTTFKGFVSGDGTLWVATEFSEVIYRADPGSKIIANINTGKLPSSILANNGQIWVATGGNGLLQYDGNINLIHQFKHDPKDSSSVPSDSVYTLFINPQEEAIWVGTEHGVGILNTRSKKFSRFTFGKNVESFNYIVIAILGDRRANLWMGTAGNGLFRYNLNDGSVKQFLPDSKDSGSIGSQFVFPVFEDKDQNIWVGTFSGKEGLWKLNGQTGKFRNYLPGITGRCMYEDQDGELWAGTNLGLYRYNKKEDNFFAFFDSQSEISNETTTGIVEDQKKNIWLSTPSAIVRINRERNVFFVFGKKFGISPNRDFFLGPICKTSNEQILVGNMNGFYTFFPEELAVDMKPLKLVITDFFFNATSGLTGKDSSFLNSAENKSEVSLAHNQNNFGFKFTVNDYRSAENIRYYTMLENYDQVWHQSGIDKTVYYFNLAPGDYMFKLIAYNSNETKGERQIRVHISPPWWKTGWAYAVYGLLLILAILTIARTQKQRIIREERQKTQAKELEQAKEIEKAYTELKSTQAQLIQSEKMASLGELTAGIAHEIQNPLNFVNNFSEVNMELTAELKESLAKLNVDDQEKRELEEIANSINENEEKISHHGKRADAIVKGMLQHSRISSGLKEPTNINQLADEYFRLAYHGLRAKEKSFNTAMKTDFDQQIEKINIVPQDLGRVLLNLYNNAFYAVTEKKQQQDAAYEPTVELSTKKTGKNIEITVRDNGNGIPKKVLEKIFHPFFTTKPAGQGTGLGLSLSFDIVKAHGGELKVDTKEGQYAMFTVTLPA